MSEKKYITLSTGKKVEYNNKDSKQYLNRITILYGGTMSGKTTLMFDILHILKKHIMIPIIFCPTTTSDSNKTYKKSFPSSLIYREVDLEKIGSIYKKQKERAEKYKIANQMNILRKLFEKVASSSDKLISEKIMRTFTKIVNGIENSKQEFGIKRALKNSAEEERDHKLKTQWKDCIRENKKQLLTMQLKSIEKICLKYLDFNPNILLLFDDCAAQSNIWSKSPIMKELFFNGRHNYITQIYTLQNDKSIPPFLRSNAHISVFTDEFSANAFFSAATNSISKNKRKFVETIVSHIFNNSGLNTHTKLVYNKFSNPSFTVTIADLRDAERYGCRSLWDYDKVLKRKNQDLFDLGNDTSYTESF